ncbi:hypothetical protein HPB48_003771 [Haemaphysalis longicornis]|uniref:Uncharacterized protein n=1 Tax=Haemaphysalis longicornis TaxID=44386 RepID=A0A9J6FIW4_HAELO|nr:hypothetical protein HPB48_003771 [Haemaphysalis longicornis]
MRLVTSSDVRNDHYTSLGLRCGSWHTKNTFESLQGLAVEAYEEGWLLSELANQCARSCLLHEEKVLAFHRHSPKLCDSRQYLLGQISSADKSPVYFDMTSNMMVSMKGAREVKLLTKSKEKLQFTVTLSCLVGSTKLRPYIVFKQKTMPSEVFPKGLVVHINKRVYMMKRRGGWVVLSSVATEARSVPQKIHSKPPYFGFVSRSFSSQGEGGAAERGRDMLVIPGGLTGQLQPLDVSVNKPFKDLLCCEYEWLVAEGSELTPRGCKKEPPGRL